MAGEPTLHTAVYRAKELIKGTSEILVCEKGRKGHPSTYALRDVDAR